jgi:AcrR family transcriptional regulator
MSGELVRDRRAERTAATRAEILAAAWELVRAGGLGSLAMRDLGARVGMRAQSLYVYFPSKYAIYDAMIAESNRELLHRVTQLPRASDPAEALRRHAQFFLEFCVEDPVRYQLLFQRTIPGFDPSPEAYAAAVEALGYTRAKLGACGINTERGLDAWTAIIGGLAAQQNANQPGGDRWLRLVNEITDMYLAHFAPVTAPHTKGR